MFVRLGDFIYQTSRCILSESSNETYCPSIISLSSRGDHLHYTRVTPQLAPMITYSTLFVWMKWRTEIDVSGTRCLVTAMRPSIHGMFSVGQIRRCACDVAKPRAMVRNRTYTKSHDVTPCQVHSCIHRWKYSIERISAVIDDTSKKFGSNNNCKLIPGKYYVIAVFHIQDEIFNSTNVCCYYLYAEISMRVIFVIYLTIRRWLS